MLAESGNCLFVSDDVCMHNVCMYVMVRLLQIVVESSGDVLED